MSERQPPHDDDAERGVLGALLLGPAVGVDPYADVSACGLGASDFFPPKHQYLFEAIAAVYDEVERPDADLVGDELRRGGHLEAVGGIEYLHELQNETPTISNAGVRARRIIEAARLRRTILLASEVTDAAYDADQSRVVRSVGELSTMATSIAASSDLDPSWYPVDLASVLDGELRRPEPSVLLRDDGRALFYAGMVNGIHGDSGVGKGWIAVEAIAGELRAGGVVVLIDLEDVADSVVARLHDVGVSNALILDAFVYLRPHEPFDDRAVRYLVDLVTARRATLVVIDSIGEAFGIEGIDENKDAEVGPWIRRVARPIADAGPAVVLVDHSTKAADNPLHPSGSKRKRAAIGGASYLVEPTKPLAQDSGGRLRLTCAKDRHGNYARAEIVANFVMSVNGDGVRTALYAPDAAPGVAAEQAAVLVAREVVRIVRESDEPLSKQAVAGLVKVKASSDAKRSGIALAVDTGAVAIESGPRGAHLLRYVHDLDPELGK